MMSAWKEPPGQDDRADGQDAGSDENQLELFVFAPDARIETLLPQTGDEGRGPRPVEIEIISESSPADPGDTDATESDELRRLEESVRWLMDAGSRRPPPLTRFATMPPLSGLGRAGLGRAGVGRTGLGRTGLGRAEARDDDARVLDPEILFPPPLPRRRGSVVRGVAKVLLVSAIAAPAAYFAASWIEFRGAAAPPRPAVISDSGARAMAGSFEAAAMTPAGPARGGEDAANAPQQAVTATRGFRPVEKTLAAPEGAEATEPQATPPQFATISATLADPAPLTVSDAPPGGSLVPVASTPKPSLHADEIALMIERGRALFKSGDIAAARLFFRRAANAGDAGAALEMGATYDPDVLKQRFIRGIEADAREAQTWYDKAREMGGTRIEMLAHR